MNGRMADGGVRFALALSLAGAAAAACLLAPPAGAQQSGGAAPGARAADVPAAADDAPAHAAQLPAWQDLPDWSGVWQMIGPTIFDAATV
ncbi:MAG TPA: hypothetical protein VFV10_07380, partial [Gammaproteobacteria bacterium]|nr:hypothetical protein [Gammaproteobacteria bacterium]